MRTTEDREWRRVEGWFKRTGSMANVSDKAFDLLSRRLRSRTRVWWICLPLLVLCAVLWLSPMFLSFNADTGAGIDRWNQASAGRVIPAFALLAVTLLLANWLSSRAERRIGATLPSRASRGAAVPLKMMLGRARMTFLMTAVVLEGALVVLLFALHPGWFAWTFLVTFVLACSLLVLGVRQAATRATVALDPSSLAIDERLRSEDAFRAAYPLSCILLAVPAPGLPSGSGGLILVWAGAGVVILLLWTWGLHSRPWQQPPRLTPFSGVTAAK